MGLNDRSYIDPRWQEYVRAPSRSFETATIEILDPQGLGAADYDFATNAGASAVPQVVWPQIEVNGYGEQPYGGGPFGGNWANGAVPNAWVEPIGQDAPAGPLPQATNITTVRIHIDLSAFGSTANIRPGFTVRVVEGDRDSTLAQRVITISKISTGNLAVQRTLECTLNEKAYL